MVRQRAQKGKMNVAVGEEERREARQGLEDVYFNVKVGWGEKDVGEQRVEQ